MKSRFRIQPQNVWRGKANSATQCHAPRAEYRFACNAIARDESDLSSAAAGRWGNWNLSPIHQPRQADLRWVLLLAALIALAGHQKLISLPASRSEA